MAAPSLDPLPTSPKVAAPIKTEDDGAALTSIGNVTQDDHPDVKSWTRERHKSFENVLADFDEEKLPTAWETLGSMLLWADPADLKKYYQELLEDVTAIDAGKISLPNYNSSVLSASEGTGEQSEVKKPAWAGQSSGGTSSVNGSGGGERKSSSKADQERRKGIPWTEEEHRLFLLGLAKYGKGDWRSISRTFVISRTPTQVASHAQKYFIRLNSINKDKRRSSIHDITSVNGGGGDTLQGGSPGPITGQSPSATVPAAQPHAHGMQPGFQAGAMYGHPAAPGGSPVGNPVYSPRQMPFGPRGHMQRPVMSGPPMMPHMGSYPMPQQAMNH